MSSTTSPNSQLYTPAVSLFLRTKKLVKPTLPFQGIPAAPLIVLFLNYLFFFLLSWTRCYRSLFFTASARGAEKATIFQTDNWRRRWIFGHGTIASCGRRTESRSLRRTYMAPEGFLLALLLRGERRRIIIISAVFPLSHVAAVTNTNTNYHFGTYPIPHTS